MTAAVYVPRRAVLVDPSPLLEALVDMADDLDARGKRAEDLGMHYVAAEDRRLALELRQQVEVHTP